MQITLTMKQLLRACKFSGIEVDEEKSVFAEDKEQLETPFVISDDDFGLFIWLEEYPDEGMFSLNEDKENIGRPRDRPTSS